MLDHVNGRPEQTYCSTCGSLLENPSVVRRSETGSLLFFCPKGEADETDMTCEVVWEQHHGKFLVTN